MQEYRTFALAAAYPDKRSFIFVLLFSLAFLLFAADAARAEVVGTEGQVYEIKERDLRELIGERAQNFDFVSWKYKELARISAQASKFRPADAASGLPPSTTGQPYNVDLTYTLPYPIHDLNGNVIYPAGYTYNPLELMQKKGLSFSKIIIVLNGTRPNEITWFKEKFDDYRAPHILLLITDGYAIELAEELGRKVMYLPEVLKERFRIKETPSLVAQLPDTPYLTVKPYVVDYRGKEQRVPKRGTGRGNR